VRLVSRRTLVAVGALVAGLALAFVVFVATPLLWLTVDETAVPSLDDMPPLPVGVAVAQQEVHCGSGGCWREVTLTGPANQSPPQLAASVGPAREICRARGLLDRREVCRGVQVSGEKVRLYLQFHRPL
jgi:hypothetical protein